MFSRLKFVSKLEEQIGLMLIRLLFKLKHLFAFVAFSTLAGFGQYFCALSLLILSTTEFSGSTRDYPLWFFRWKPFN